MKNIKKIALGLFSIPASALAATGDTFTPPITKAQDIINLMCKILSWMFWGLIVFSVIMIVVAGFNYVTAGDNSEKVSKATKMILYAAIGIAVALIAKGIPPLIASFIGASGSFVAC